MLLARIDAPRQVQCGMHKSPAGMLRIPDQARQDSQQQALNVTKSKGQRIRPLDIKFEVQQMESG